MASRAVTTGASGATLATLLACAPLPSAALDELADLSTTTDAAAPFVAAVALSAWALSAWLLLAVLLTVLGRAPGSLGRLAARLARRCVPAAARTTLELALGLTVATGVLSTGTVHAAGPPAHDSPTGRDTAVLPAGELGPLAPGESAASGPPFDLDWPTSTPAAAARAPAVRPEELATARAEPVATPATSTVDAPPPASPPGRPPAVAGPAPAAPSARTAVVAGPAPGAPSTRTAVVVVRPGDTLWDLAAAALQRDGVPAPSEACIAQTWPRWWAANREVIGPDPDLILPGTPLSPPADRAPARSAHAPSGRSACP